MALKEQVLQLAGECGFARCGVAPAGEVANSRPLRDWLGRSWHAGMEYMESNLDLRLRPDLLVPGALSVLCLAVPYGPGGDDLQEGGEHIARYARGRDYHRVLKDRCRRLMDRIRRVFPALEGRAFVDSAPVMERTLAARAGLGWIGRNGCLVVPGLGSYVLLCEIISNLPLEADGPVGNRCGDCGACVRACPTGALDGAGLVNARKCISYLTIEERGEIPAEYWSRMGGRIFGCDACQAACPHNKNVPAGDEAFRGRSDLGERHDLCSVRGKSRRDPFGTTRPANLSPRAILSLSREDWDRATRGRAVRRATYEMLLRNAAIAAGNSGDRSLVEPLRRLRGDHPELAAVIDWAMSALEAGQ